MPRASLLLALLLTLLCLNPAHGAKLVDGSFLAATDCPAYASKAQQTNPGEVRLVPGRIYPVFEVNLQPNPDWYRLRIDGAEPKERWVSAACGEYPPKSPPSAFAGKATTTPSTSTSEAPTAPPPTMPSGPNCPTPAPSKEACRTCGKIDSYKLALNWQPGFCETQKRNLDEVPECRNTDPNAYEARNFTLHGLWPNQRNCGKGMGFCGSVDHEMKPFTSYPAITLSESTRQTLTPIMPSVGAGSGLERHEWHKHGTCTGYPEDAYFIIAADLARQFNQSGMGAFMAGKVGQQIRREELFQQVEKSFGNGARRKMNIECSADGQLLTGIHINLPSGLKPGMDLKTLIQQAPSAGARGNCAGRIVVDAIGLQ